MLYTRKGDTGTTGLFGCDQRLSKSSAIAEALGALDEANSYLGLCRAFLTAQLTTVPIGKRRIALHAMVRGAQESLFIVQAEVAGAGKRVPKGRVSSLESHTDTLECLLPPIHSFSVPGQTALSAHLDVARTLVRRAERRVVAVSEEGVVRVGPHTLAYLNRLSSLLFALARYVNAVEGATECAPTYR